MAETRFCCSVICSLRAIQPGNTPLEQAAARNVFMVWEGAALVVGGTGLVVALMTQAGTSDPEYAPLTILALVAAHGLVGLIASLTDIHPGPTATT